jgi:hypothetical protein
MAYSKIKFVDWAYAIYFQAVSLKGVSSMRLYHELGIASKRHGLWRIASAKHTKNKAQSVLTCSFMEGI